MAVPQRPDEPSPRLARLLERGKREVDLARREVIGDPDQAFDDWVRESYDLYALEEVFHDMIEEGPGWLDDDDETVGG